MARAHKGSVEMGLLEPRLLLADTLTGLPDPTVLSDPPAVAADDYFTTIEDSGVKLLDVLVNDAGDGLAILDVSAPAGGEAWPVYTARGFRVAYRPAADFQGVDSFTYTVIDAYDNQAGATVWVTVTDVNDPPAAAPDALTVDQDSGPSPLDVLGNDTAWPDSPDEPLRVVAVDPATYGTVTIAPDGQGLIYTPAPGFTGDDVFGYTIADDDGATASAVVTVTVAPVETAMVIDLAGGAATVITADGTEVRVSLEGPGAGRVVLSADGTSIQRIELTGTTARTKLHILPGGSGGQTVPVGDIVVDGSLKQIVAPRVQLLGRLDITGDVGQVVLAKPHATGAPSTLPGPMADRPAGGKKAAALDDVILRVV